MSGPMFQASAQRSERLLFFRPGRMAVRTFTDYAEPLSCKYAQLVVTVNSIRHIPEFGIVPIGLNRSAVYMAHASVDTNS